MLLDILNLNEMSCLVYIYMFVGCVVLVINKSTTKQNNIGHSTYITLFNSRRFECKLFFSGVLSVRPTVHQ